MQLTIAFLLGCSLLLSSGAQESLVVDINNEEKIQYHSADFDRGNYRYGYDIEPPGPQGQFHHEKRGEDGVVYGCYGFLDPNDEPAVTYYISDAWGYHPVREGGPVEVFYPRDHPPGVSKMTPTKVDWTLLPFSKDCGFLAQQLVSKPIPKVLQGLPVVAQTLSRIPQGPQGAPTQKVVVPLLGDSTRRVVFPGAKGIDSNNEGGRIGAPLAITPLKIQNLEGPRVFSHPSPRVQVQEQNIPLINLKSNLNPNEKETPSGLPLNYGSQITQITPAESRRNENPTPEETPKDQKDPSRSIEANPIKVQQNAPINFGFQALQFPQNEQFPNLNTLPEPGRNENINQVRNGPDNRINTFEGQGPGTFISEKPSSDFEAGNRVEPLGKVRPADSPIFNSFQKSIPGLRVFRPLGPTTISFASKPFGAVDRSRNPFFLDQNDGKTLPENRPQDIRIIPRGGQNFALQNTINDTNNGPLNNLQPPNGSTLESKPNGPEGHRPLENGGSNSFVNPANNTISQNRPPTPQKFQQTPQKFLIRTFDGPRFDPNNVFSSFGLPELRRLTESGPINGASRRPNLQFDPIPNEKPQGRQGATFNEQGESPNGPNGFPDNFDYSRLPGAIVSSVPVIFYPDCNSNAFSRPAVVPYCPSERSSGCQASSDNLQILTMKFPSGNNQFGGNTPVSLQRGLPRSGRVGRRTRKLRRVVEVVTRKQEKH